MSLVCQLQCASAVIHVVGGRCPVSTRAAVNHSLSRLSARWQRAICARSPSL